ncbi:antibiotic biosynthesis monooxygenase [Pseudonocardia sp. S2-4]|uniref:Antibiotic biosynthesis monooxygenase n=1 Tax=Pseudonocardia humida TaxID=2800819 RepID=A0ABT1A107_9PSEU|nr:antibiotic biosynthesis monooxygenase [Pseudonocardia humida]
MLLVCRFDVPAAEADDLRVRARAALELLTAQPGCRGGELGRAVDEPDAWVLVVRFESVNAYRRALSPFPVREHVVPLLAQAGTDAPAAFETLVDAVGGRAQEHTSLLAE